MGNDQPKDSWEVKPRDSQQPPPHQAALLWETEKVKKQNIVHRLSVQMVYISVWGLKIQENLVDAEEEPEERMRRRWWREDAGSSGRDRAGDDSGADDDDGGDGDEDDYE